MQHARCAFGGRAARAKPSTCLSAGAMASGWERAVHKHWRRCQNLPHPRAVSNLEQELHYA